MRIKPLQPHCFTNKQARTVQRAINIGALSKPAESSLKVRPDRRCSGCVRVIPGSHHKGQLAHFDDHNDALTMLSRG